MKKATIFCAIIPLFLMHTPDAKALSWVTVGNSPNGIYQYSPESIERLGGKVIVSTNITISENIPSANSRVKIPPTSVRSRVVFDCKDMTYRESGNSFVMDAVNPKTFEQIPPKKGDVIDNDFYKELYKILCEREDHIKGASVNPGDGQGGDSMATELISLADRTYRHCGAQDLDKIKTELIVAAKKVSDSNGIISYDWGSHWSGVAEYKKNVVIRLIVSYTHCVYNGNERRINVFQNGELIAYADKELDEIRILK